MWLDARNVLALCVVVGHMTPCSIVHSMIPNMCSRCTVRTETTFFFEYWLRFRSRQELPVIFSGLLLASEFAEVKDTFGATFFTLSASTTHMTHTRNLAMITMEVFSFGRLHSARSHTPKGSTSRAKLFYTILDAETFQALYR